MFESRSIVEGYLQMNNFLYLVRYQSFTGESLVFKAMMPPMISAIPSNFTRSSASFQNIKPTNAVNAVPAPDQMAYTRLRGRVRRHRDNK